MNFPTRFRFRFAPLLLVLVFTCGTTFLAAQDSLQRKHTYSFSIGPKLIQSYFLDSDLNVEQLLIGNNLNLEIHLPLGPHLHFITGLSFQQNRFAYVDYNLRFGCDNVNGMVDIFNSWSDTRYQLNYIGVPLALKLQKPGALRPWFARLGLDPMISLRGDEQQVIVECLTVSSQQESHDISDLLSDFVLKARLGLGYEWPMGSRLKLLVEPQMAVALTDYFVEDAQIGGVSNLLSNQLDWSLLIGVRF